ncbi:GFA family protein [Oleomonas cavernae]|uniref:GFA family protein n=1 Tax=Oleomonas cavernae TaxID=2320859 RepID=A0A418WHY2_9PROT|nr:GFA family protein [Oleomonas cavernae]RJF89656.1 GFA family protein [Oleomonas cavernae]
MRQGSCHCGKIAFTLAAEPTEAIECNCSHCSRKGYLLAFFPHDTLVLTTPRENLATYTFNRHVLQHHFCPACGCAPFAEGQGPKGPMVAVNLRCVEGIDRGALTVKQVDGKSF